MQGASAIAEINASREFQTTLASMLEYMRKRNNRIFNNTALTVDMDVYLELILIDISF